MRTLTITSGEVDTDWEGIQYFASPYQPKKEKGSVVQRLFDFLEALYVAYHELREEQKRAQALSSTR